MKQFAMRLFLLTLACLVAITATTSAAKKSLDEQRQEIREMSKVTLSKLYEKYPSAQRVIGECYGYATLSNSNTNIILFSSSRGRGLAVNNRTGEEVFMKMKEVGIGLGAGAREFDLVFVFDDEDAWNRFLTGKNKFGGEVSATATDGNAGGAVEGATLASKGIWIYQMTTKGLSLEATLNSTSYYKDKKLNKKSE